MTKALGMNPNQPFYSLRLGAPCEIINILSIWLAETSPVCFVNITNCVDRRAPCPKAGLAVLLSMSNLNTTLNADGWLWCASLFVVIQASSLSRPIVLMHNEAQHYQVGDVSRRGLS